MDEPSQPLAPSEPSQPPVPELAKAPQSSPGCLQVAGIGIFSLTWLGPLIVLGWLVSFGLSATVAGRMLKQAHCTTHFSFDNGFWLGVGLLGFGVAVEAVRWLSADAAAPPKTHMSNAFAWWPLALGAGAAAGTWLWQLVLNQPLDDMGFAAAATLVIAVGVLGSVPILLRLASLPVRLLWAVSKLSAVAAGMVAGGTLVAGALAGLVEYGSGTAVVEAFAEAQAQRIHPPARQLGSGDKAPDFVLRVALAAADSEEVSPAGAEDVTGAASELPPAAALQTARPATFGAARPYGPGPRLDLERRPKAATNRCVDELGANCGVRPCAFDEVKARLRRRLQEADATFVANVALFEVCMNAVEGESLDVWRGALYSRAMWREGDELRRQWKECKRYARLPIDDSRPAMPPAAQREAAAAAIRTQIANALCTLSETDQCVLRAWLEEQADALTATLCDLTNEAMVRQQRKRAIDRLRGKVSNGEVKLEFDEM